MFYVRLEGLPDLRKVLHAPSEELAREQRALLHRSVILIAQEARQRVYSRSGRAKRGIRADVIGSGSDLRGIVKPRNTSAIFSQRTRRPGRPQPPLRAVQRWLKREGRDASRATAFLIARAIGRRGTQGHPVMAASLEAKRTEIVALFVERIQRALRRH